MTTQVVKFDYLVLVGTRFDYLGSQIWPLGSQIWPIGVDRYRMATFGCEACQKLKGRNSGIFRRLQQDIFGVCEVVVVLVELLVLHLFLCGGEGGVGQVLRVLRE